MLSCCRLPTFSGGWNKSRRAWCGCLSFTGLWLQNQPNTRQSATFASSLPYVDSGTDASSVLTSTCARLVFSLEKAASTKTTKWLIQCKNTARRPPLGKTCATSPNFWRTSSSPRSISKRPLNNDWATSQWPEVAPSKETPDAGAALQAQSGEGAGATVTCQTVTSTDTPQMYRQAQAFHHSD